MNIEIIKSKTGTYKIISRSNVNHPILIHLAKLLKESNKRELLKVGVFSVCGGEFERTKRVKSYISGRIEKMDKNKYYKWLKGDKQMISKVVSIKGDISTYEQRDKEFIKTII